MAGGGESVRRDLLDTSVFIVRESGRRLGELSETAAVSVVTVAELHLGVLMAQGDAIRARRLRTLTAVQNAFEPLAIDAEVARTFAELVAAARRRGKKPKIMNAWIAATAMAHGFAIYTQDEDFAEMPQVVVHRV